MRIPFFLTFECKKIGKREREGTSGNTLPMYISLKEHCVFHLSGSENILPYWKLDKAKSLENRNLVGVGLWDLTEENYGRTNRYEDGSLTFRKLDGLDYSLSCMTLINLRGLGVGDEIGLCWNPIISMFMFKLICRAVLND
ncbi:hypothetical protein H5410_028608 [Solanum commersonii]|uniref:Uncharacterized protein n=1 Tax=Solanum commersonii TaxID=4109 RepID=A0A9J5Z6M3_SOLCO|nr:hypothetical protein H5410_028608 [Solanum commersonii]